MKRNGENIIVTKIGEIREAREKAKKLSKSYYHSWAFVWYINSQSKKLCRAAYTEGRLYQDVSWMNMCYSETAKGWLSVLDALVKFGEGWVKENAIRLGGTGMHTKW